MWLCGLLLALGALAITGAFLLRTPGTSLLVSGQLVPVSSPDCHGYAELIQKGERRLLRLRGIKGCGDAPAEVLLLASSNARDDETVESTVQLRAGTLPAHTAGLDFDLPTAVTLERYRAVSLWDGVRRLNLATAPLRER